MSCSGSPPSLSGSAARGVLWTGAGQVIRQVIQLGTSLVLVRLLIPEDFGLLGMATFFVGIGQLLADFGIGAAIMHARTTDRRVLSSCFWLNMAVACALSAAVVFVAPLIGSFYHRSDLAPVVAVLALNLVLSGLLVVPSTLLVRDLRFASYTRAQILGSLVGAITAIALAFRGFGVWSLVAQPLCGTTIVLISCLVSARWYPRFEYSWVTVQPLARFSSALLGTNLVGYVNRNADSVLIGRVLGAGALGFYAMAIQLMLYPLQQVSSVFVRVLLPTLMQLQDEVTRLRTAYLKTVTCIALVTFPIMGGLFAVADDLVQVVFGPGWTEMTPVVKVLAWVGMLQSIGTTVGTIYLSTGNPAIALRVTLIGTPVLVAGMAGGLPWGILGVAIGYAAASFSFFYYSVATAFQLIELTLAEFHEALVRPLGATLAMVGVVVLANIAMPDVEANYRLAICVSLGIVAYSVASLVVNRAQIAEMIALLRTLRTKASP